MAVTPYQLPTVATQSVKGATSWTSLFRIKTNDDTGVGANNGFVTPPDTFTERYAHLVIGDTIITAVNKAGNADITGTGWSFSYGGAADLWSQTLTPAIVNDGGFGVAWAIGKKHSGVGADLSYYAIATGFSFGIPDDATITGIEFFAEGDNYDGGAGTTGIGLDSIQVRVNYTWAPKIRAQGHTSGFVYSSLVQRRKAPQKKFRYLLFDHSDNFIGEWQKVTSSPSFITAVNNLMSSMNIQLGQNEESVTTLVEELLTEASENLITESSENILVDLSAQIGLGPGTDTDTNNNLELISYYGQDVELLTEAGDIMITEYDEILLVDDGAPQGRRLFTGYLPEWELDMGTSDDVGISILSHSQELDQIMLESSDILKVSGGAYHNTFWGLHGSTPTEFTRYCQTFVMSGSVPVGRIKLIAKSLIRDATVPVTLTLTDGTGPLSPGTTLATAVAGLTSDPDNIDTWKDLDFLFDQVNLTNGTTYEFFVDVPSWAASSGGIYPIQFQAGSASSALYVEVGGTTWTTGNENLAYEVYQPGGATTVTYNSMDPSEIWKDIIDFARTRGARANYTADTIEMTGTVVSVKLESNTVAEALAAMIKYMPSDWYSYYDFGENLVHVHPRPTTPARYHTKGRDVVTGKVKRSIIGIVNDVFLTGGDTGSGNLFLHQTDNTSIATTRRGVAKIVDQRVTDQTTGEILMQAAIDRNSGPVYSGNLVIVETDRYIEDFTIGEMSGFSGWGQLVDSIQIQNVSHTYHPETLEATLNTLLPKVQQRVEDIKRNLDDQATTGNPTSPTVV